MNELDQHKKALKEGEELIRMLSRAVIEARDSVPPSMSQVMDGFKKDLKEIKETQASHNSNELAHWEAMKPVIDAFNEKKGFWKTLKTIATYVGIGTAIIVGLKMIGGVLLTLVGINSVTK